MPSLEQLILAMYRETPAFRSSSQVTARSASETFVRKAPVQRLGEAEIAARLGALQRAIAADLLAYDSRTGRIEEVAE